MQVGSQTARMVLWIPVPKVGMNEGMMTSRMKLSHVYELVTGIMRLTLPE